METSNSNSESFDIIKKPDYHPLALKSLITGFKNELENRKLSISTIRGKLTSLKDFFLTMKIKDLEEVRIEHVEAFRRILSNRVNLQGENIKANTINNKLTNIKEFFHYLWKMKRREYVRNRDNPEIAESYLRHLELLIDEYEFITDITFVKKQKRDQVPSFTLKELKKMLFCTLYDKDLGFKFAYRNFLILLFSAVGTGARNSAVRLLKKRDLDCYKCIGSYLLKFFFFNIFPVTCEKCIPIAKIERKNRDGKYRVQVEKRTCQLLKDFIINSGRYSTEYVFESKSVTIRKSHITQEEFRDKALRSQGTNRILRKAKQLAGIPDDNRTFHSLRRTFITETYKNGTKYEIVAKQLDHQSMLGVTGLYESSNPKDWKINFINFPEFNEINWN
ncbi:MAG: tyrosine-type recombinase/integrase [Promethearchaeota archaeon]